MPTEYELQRQKNIEANRLLLESLGIPQLSQTIVAKAAPPPPKPKKKPAPVKRKRSTEDDENDHNDEEPKQKAVKAVVDDSSADGRRRSRRSGAAVNYNEDALEQRGVKVAEAKKRVERELGEDRDGRVGNKLGERLHDP